MTMDDAMHEVYREDCVRALSTAVAALAKADDRLSRLPVGDPMEPLPLPYAQTCCALNQAKRALARLVERDEYREIVTRIGAVAEMAREEWRRDWPVDGEEK